MIRLYINNEEVDLSEDVDFPITFSQADAKKPESRTRSSSKTIILPGTQRNNRRFLSAYNLKASDVYGDLIGFDFDPTLRYPFLAERNGKPFFSGSTNLTKVTRKKYEEHGTVNNFNIVLFSEITDLFQSLGDIKVSELGWEAYNHILNVTNIQASWTAATGSGYWYPLIDYGLSADPLSIKTNQLYPHVYVKEILEKCFAHGGYVLSGGFFSQTLYKKLVWGSGGGEPILLNSSEVAERRVEYTGDGTLSANINYSSITNLLTNTYTNFNTNITLQIATLSPVTLTLVNDDLTQLDDPNGEITITYAGQYSLAINGTFPLTYAYSDAGLVDQEFQFKIKWLIFVNGAVINSFDYDVYDTASGSENIVFSETQALDLSAGDIIKQYIVINTTGSKVGETALSDTLDITFDLDNTLSFDLTAINSGLIDGDTVHISRFLPDMKAADFLKDMIIMFNLYMSDPDTDGNVVLLPQDEYFYETDDVDQWSDKIARDNPVDIMPASNIEGKRYRFRWAEDRDYYKKLYFEKFGIDYGDFDYNVPSTFKTGDKVYQVGIAQSCPVQIEGTDIIIPRIISVDESTQTTKPYKGKPRMYFNNGFITCDPWKLVNSDTGAVTTSTKYPQAHHLSTLTTAAFDLNFGRPSEVFYVATTYTNDNLFSRFYAGFIRELTGRDSKVLNAWFRLNENDFYENFMRRLCNIDGVLYRKNIIKDWIANKNNLVKCELIKIVAGRSTRTYVTSIPEVRLPPLGPVTNADGTTTPVTVDTTAKSYRSFYPMDSSAGNRIITVNADDLKEGWSMRVYKTQAANNVQIVPTGGGGSARIDGAIRLTLTDQYASATVIFDGSQFYTTSNTSASGGGSGLTQEQVEGLE